MIYYLVHQKHGYTVDRYLQGFGAPLQGRITILPYEYLDGIPRLQAGTYVFSDVDRLSRTEAFAAAILQDALADSGIARVLNHPTRSMKRYELLRTMRAHCINAFDVYRLTEARTPHRFPVFLREENEHNGSLTGLLETPDELDAAIETVLASGVRRDDCLVVEFCDTSDCHGTFRKHTACRVGERIVPTHIIYGDEWMLKSQHGNYERNVPPEAQLAEHAEYVYGNPHEAELSRVFDLAHTDFGRIDYAMLDGQVQVWEINTNPNLLGTSALRAGYENMTRHSADGMLAAFSAIDSLASVRESIPNPLRSGMWARAVREGARTSFRTGLSLLGLGAYGRRAEKRLARVRRLFG